MSLRPHTSGIQLRVLTWASSSLSLLSLAGCGLNPPSISQPWESDFVYTGDNLPEGVTSLTLTGSSQMEYEIRKRIFCELKLAVIDAQKLTSSDDGKNVSKLIPEDWVAHVSLSLTVDESTSISPGVSLKTPMPAGIVHFAGEKTGSAVASGLGYGFSTVAQSFSLGLGGTGSATATRIDKFDPYYLISNLQTEMKSPHICETYNQSPDKNDFYNIASGGGFQPSTSSLLIHSNLRIKDWLIGSMYSGRLVPSHIDLPPPTAPTPKTLAVQRDKLRKQGFAPQEIAMIMASKGGGGGGASPVGGGPKPDTASLEIKFVILTNANVTPSWNLVRVASNTSSQLLTVGRTQTHDLIITIGPPNNDTAYSHLASQIGQAVASQINGR